MLWSGLADGERAAPRRAAMHACTRSSGNTRVPATVCLQPPCNREGKPCAGPACAGHSPPLAWFCNNRAALAVLPATLPQLLHSPRQHALLHDGPAPRGAAAGEQALTTQARHRMKALHMRGQTASPPTHAPFSSPPTFRLAHLSDPLQLCRPAVNSPLPIMRVYPGSSGPHTWQGRAGRRVLWVVRGEAALWQCCLAVCTPSCCCPRFSTFPNPCS